MLVTGSQHPLDESLTEKQLLERHRQLKSRYGITLDEYREMWDAQGGVCALCEEPSRSISKHGTPEMLAVDHSHETGAVRALLCRNCNSALGLLNDSVPLLRRAIRYLEQF